MPAVYDYIAVINFDDGESDAAQRQWLANMRTHLLDIAASGDPIESYDVYAIGGSGGLVSIDCHEDLSLSGLQLQLRRVSDKLEFARLHGPNPLPDPWTTKHRRAG